MHEYITNFGDMVGHAYSIKPTNGVSQELASNFIEVVQNPHVQNKLSSYQIKNLKEIFGHAIHKDPKQKMRALDFGINSKPEYILTCDMNAIREKVCFKCGSESHFIKGCPLSEQDTKVLGIYAIQKTNTNTNSTPDQVMEPLTRLFTDLIEQLRLLILSGHIHTMVILITREMASTVTSGHLFLVAIGNMVPPSTIDTVMPIATASMTTDIRLTLDRKDITGTARTL